MSEKLTAKSYLELVKKAQIVPPDQLSQSLKRLSQAHAGGSVSLQALADHLLSEGLVTKWQNEQLLQGRHKGFFLGQYRLLRLLGSGGMSAVYLAQHMIANNLRAIKVLPKSRAADKSYLERFYLEGRAAASLKHPNIAQIADLASTGDLHYMVIEFVEGTDLDQMVKEKGPLDYLTALEYLRQATDALRHAHSRNIIHRDIKPANLMVSNDQKTIKLLDLGLALMRDAESSLTIQHNERVMGTADYLSPEQAIDSHKVDHRADIYSLGCTFYFMLAGHPPFPEGSIAQRIAKHQSADPVELTTLREDCPLPVARLCQRMMQKKPEDRFADCQKLYDSVQKVITLLTLDQKAKIETTEKTSSTSTPTTMAAGASPKIQSTSPANSATIAKGPQPKNAAPSKPANLPSGANASPSPSAKPSPVPVAGTPGKVLQDPASPTTSGNSSSSQKPPAAASPVSAAVPLAFDGDAVAASKKRADPEFLDFEALASLDQGSRTDLSALAAVASTTPVAPRLREDRKSNIKFVLLIAGIVIAMFSALIVALYFLNRFLT
ncbi:MAG: serine/threonine protein kinase [Pirellulaceae bacterium]|jgi:eukaryotic-like serine/threonine-protein kinase|nr:serine/threonine protein kinase [Pirellulaceae bacterium]